MLKLCSYIGYRSIKCDKIGFESLLGAQQLYTQTVLSVRCPLSVRQPFSKSQMKVKVTGIICINQLCH